MENTINYKAQDTDYIVNDGVVQCPACGQKKNSGLIILIRRPEKRKIVMCFDCMVNYTIAQHNRAERKKEKEAANVDDE